MPELKLYTVAQIREWLEHNHPAEGLSERVIAPTRAWAIIHNPYVKDDDEIVAAIFEDGQLAAYTASFPDMIEGKRAWWASTLYCYPQFAGRGYGMIVVGSLMEAHEPDMTYDRWGASETIEIFNHFGYQTAYTPRYHLGQKDINKSTLRGKIAYGVDRLKRCIHPWPKHSKENYTLLYTSYIDGEAYAFMQSHRDKDLWIREQDMLNWIVRYPFRISCPIHERVDKDNEFKACVQSYEYHVVKVYNSEQLVGVYILRKCVDSLAVVYLYCNEDEKEIVYASIVDHLVSLKPQSFTTEDEELLTYVQKRLYFPKKIEEHVSFSIPVGVVMPENYAMQMGDGDSFA